MRSFIGIKLNDCITNIASIIDELRQVDKNANYTLLSNIHITIEFLGEINEEDILKIKKIFSNLNFNSFTLNVDSLKNLRDMIILGVETNQYLNLLHGLINSELKKAGFTLQDRKYYPHVTICRKSNLNLLKSLELKSDINEIILFSSSRINNELVYAPILIKQLKKV